MTSANETIIHKGKGYYRDGIYDSRFWSSGNMEMKNFLWRFVAGQKRGLAGIADRATKDMSEKTVGGHFVLTNECFIFGKGKNIKNFAAGGPDNISPDDKYFAIPLSKIIDFQIEKALLGTGVLIIESKKGLYKFAISETPKWENALNKALAPYGKKPGLPRDTEGIDIAYCSRCGKPTDALLGLCPECEAAHLINKDRVSKMTKNYITKIWLFGVFGLLGFHFFAVKRFVPD